MNKRSLMFACALAAMTVAAAGCNESVPWEKKAVCGNGTIEAGEICDTYANVSCSYLDPSKTWISGTPGCDSACNLTQGTCTAKVTTCGNGVLDDGEACDAGLFKDPSVSCESILGAGATGNVVCANCQVSTAGCIAATTCGNGVVDANEKCDGSDFGGVTCENFAGEGATGSLVCNSNCMMIDASDCKAKTVPETCGNGALDDGEDCDGEDLNGKTCADFKGEGATGTLSCNNCAIDSSACVAAVSPEACGNGTIDADEECDGENLNGKTCVDYKGTGATGALSCNGCKIDSSACEAAAPVETCGNGAVDDGEECDGAVSDVSCADALNDEHAIGDVVCAANCTIDKSQCTIPAYCGDGVRNGSEQCEGTDLDGKTCEDYKGKGATGALSCNSDCTINASACEAAAPVASCGDGKLDDNEECDKTVFIDNITDCAVYGSTVYSSGKLSCNDNCTINEDACVKICGNGKLDAGEECDGTVFSTGKDSCGAIKEGTSGNLTCNASCKIDSSACVVKCGDGIVGGNEDCDGNAFLADVTDCKEYDSNKYESGKLACTSTCSYDFSACKEPVVAKCGDGKLDAGEECDGSNFNGKTCVDYKGEGATGSLSCDASCKIVSTACTAATVGGDFSVNYELVLPGDALDAKKTAYTSAVENVKVGNLTYSAQGRFDSTDGFIMSTTNSGDAANYITITGFEGVGEIVITVKSNSTSEDTSGKMGYDVIAGDTKKQFSVNALKTEFENRSYTISDASVKSITIKPSTYVATKNKGRIYISKITWTAVK